MNVCTLHLLLAMQSRTEVSWVGAPGVGCPIGVFCPQCCLRVGLDPPPPATATRGTFTHPHSWGTVRNNRFGTWEKVLASVDGGTEFPPMCLYPKHSDLNGNSNMRNVSEGKTIHFGGGVFLDYLATKSALYVVLYLYVVLMGNTFLHQGHEVHGEIKV